MVFFVWVSVFNLFVVSLFWSFMADIFSSGESHRYFPLIALGGTAGALARPAADRRCWSWCSAWRRCCWYRPRCCWRAMAILMWLSVSAGGRVATRRRPIGGSLLAGARQVFTASVPALHGAADAAGDGIGTLAYALVADYVKAQLPRRRLRAPRSTATSTWRPTCW